MATNANAIATSVNNVERDQFGRDVAERTVELTPQCAEYINREVQDGRHQTYDSALEYVIARGLAEIKRTRDAAAKTAQAKLTEAKKASWKKMFESNPALAVDPNVVATMMKDLGLMPKV